MRALRATVQAAALALFVSGCSNSDAAGEPDENDAGNDPADANVAAKFSEIYPLIFPATTNARCDFCHAMTANNVSNGSLHTGSDIGTAYAALVGKPSAGSMCKDRVLVVPNDPGNSLLLQKLLPNPACGSRMPLGGKALTDGQLEQVRSWIAAGAKND